MQSEKVTIDGFVFHNPAPPDVEDRMEAACNAVMCDGDCGACGLFSREITDERAAAFLKWEESRRQAGRKESC